MVFGIGGSSIIQIKKKRVLAWEMIARVLFGTMNTSLPFAGLGPFTRTT
jgi:hypothetical protein